MKRQSVKIPTFRTEHDERAFWQQHSVEEFAEVLEDLDVVIQPARTEQIALRLRKEDLETLQTVAKQKGVGHTTLVRSIVEQWVTRWRQSARRSRMARSR